ncbi:phosphoadenosine phosphosulfate reductase family protein [Buttiauxella sp. BIGb0552]|uniref:phosphoadenosine phosphosulfate reductase domain-containing protein n=1 Tax=Buttiauxella TaxID=82976 RepID=UPI0010E9452F|nr:phosphoadenosine phosphosulfate reductase family protein [Buttiauxella sp. BIGb0552]TDX14593.1 phosphoadenosine phosphosulfate reductase family protein [Buttiauxella sp. BIGb0552]
MSNESRKAKIQVVSFSGGRTSAYLVHLMEQLRVSAEMDVRYIFMDTGAEHPATYQFIRDVVSHWGIELTCLRVKVNPELGQGNSYQIIPLESIGPDLQPWIDVTEKYGTPYFGGAFCTRTMKIEVCERYCKDNFDTYDSWLGMRLDEQGRIWGERLFPLLRRLGFEDMEMRGLYAELREMEDEKSSLQMLEQRYLLDTATAQRICDRVKKVVKSNQRFMSEISDYQKEDVLTWWKSQSFDLQLEEHLGNCVFCIKKGINKVALAMRDEPEMAAQFREVIMSESVRVVERRQQENKVMYRKSLSLDAIAEMYSGHSREEIAATIRGNKAYESGSCSESCEAFIVDNGQMDLFDSI